MWSSTEMTVYLRSARSGSGRNVTVRSAPVLAVVKLDLAVVILDQVHIVEEQCTGLVDQLRQHAEGGDQADVVGMVVDHHPGVGPQSMQFGVDVDGGRDIPSSADHPGVLVDDADVGCGQFLPP